MTDKRFEHPVMADFNEALEFLELSEYCFEKALQELPERIGGNEELRMAILSHMYWQQDRVKANKVAQLFGLAKGTTLHRIVGGLSVTAACEKCNQEFESTQTSRSSGTERFCTACKAEKERLNAESHKEYMARLAIEEEQHRQYLEYLHTMPYYEYLQTSVWQERRKRIMKKAGFRCQVCNAYGVRLNVHHRTYERRGYELDRDLIVLCQGCHQIFHENGSLEEE